MPQSRRGCGSGELPKYVEAEGPTQDGSSVEIVYENPMDFYIEELKDINSHQGTGNTYSQLGLKYIKSWEDISLTSYDAIPGTGDWTIGWGHKLQEYSGQKRNPNISITQEEADQWFEDDINRMLDTTFTSFLEDNNITLTPNQYDAMLSFTFNYGENSWGPDGMTVMKNFLIAGNYTEEASKKAFQFYIDKTPRSQAGNVQRRKDEIEMFLYGKYNYHK